MDTSKFLLQLITRLLTVYAAGFLAKLGYTEAEAGNVISGLAAILTSVIIAIAVYVWAAIERRFAIDKALKTPPPPGGANQ